MDWHAAVPDVLCAGGENLSGIPTLRIYHGSWSVSTPLTEPGWVDAVAADPGRPDSHVYVGGWSKARGIVFRTSNAGATWEDLSDGEFAGPVLGLAVAPDGSGRVFAASEDGLRVRDGSGGHWARLLDIPLHRVRFAGDSTGALFACGRGGLWRSGDLGRSWEDLTPGLPGRAIDEFAAMPDQGLVFASAAGGSVFRLRLDAEALLFAPLSLRAARQENRSLFLREFRVELRWEEDPRNPAGLKHKVYRSEPESGAWVLLGDIAPGVHEFFDRGVPASKMFIYMVRPVGASGREGGAATVSI